MMNLNLKIEKFYLKALLHLLLFVSIFLFVLPSLFIDCFRWLFFDIEGGFFLTWLKFFFKPLLEGGLSAFVFCLSVVLGLSAVQEFALRGKGTLFNPPKKFVQTGAYAFVRQPMQLSLFLIGLDHLIIFLCNHFPLIGLFLLMFVGLSVIVFPIVCLLLGVYFIWIKRMENKALKARFGKEFFENYKAEVSYFVPRWRAFRTNPAELYIDFNHCSACAKLKRIVLWLSPRKLNIYPAEHYRQGSITRLTYRDRDFEAVGINAMCRTLEHTNLVLALIGFTLRLPPLSWILQTLSDKIFPPHPVKTRP